MYLNPEGRFYRTKFILLLLLVASLTMVIPLNVFLTLCGLAYAALDGASWPFEVKLLSVIAVILGAFYVLHLSWKLCGIGYGMVALATTGGRHLFHSPWEFVWWRTFAIKSAPTNREGVRIKQLLKSEDREKIREGIRLAKASKCFDSFIYNISPTHFMYQDGNSAINFEEALKAGARTNRFDFEFNPITFICIARRDGSLHRELLDLVLAAGADINDGDVQGHTLLDKYLINPKSIDDVEYLLGMGATPHPRMIATLQESKSQAAPMCRALLEQTLLDQVAQESRPAKDQEDRRRAM